MATKLNMTEYETWCKNLSELLDKTGKEWIAAHVASSSGVVLSSVYRNCSGITFVFKQGEGRGEATVYVNWDLAYHGWSLPDEEGDAVSPVEFSITVNFPTYGGVDLKTIRRQMSCMEAAVGLSEFIEYQKNIFMDALGPMTVIIETKEERAYKALKKSAADFVEKFCTDNVAPLRKLQVGQALCWNSDIKETTYSSHHRKLVGGYTKQFNVDLNGNGVLSITRTN
jgi:hypothetical protein